MLRGADVGDSLAVNGSVQGGETAAFMDKAHAALRRETLAEACIVDGIHAARPARRPLTEWQRWMSAALAPTRGRLERAFGTLMRSHGWRCVRYRALVETGAHLDLLCAAMNLRRAEGLVV